MDHLGTTQDTPPEPQFRVTPRRLLPAPVKNVDVDDNPTRSTQSLGRSKVVKAACEECRMRKVKALRRKHIEATHDNQRYHELYRLLQIISEVEAQQILLQIRLGTDIESLLRQVRGGEVLLQKSLVPDKTRHYAFPYITAMPAFLLQPTAKNPYLGSLLYDAAFDVKNTPLLSPTNPRPTRVSYMKPFHATRLVYPLLFKVQASRWTTVNSNEELLRALLQAYIIHEYPTYPAVHLDLFLQAMESPRVSKETLCSPLLVNTILAIACQCYNRTTNHNEFWNPQTLGYRFLAEAKRLWELECDTPAITTLQAAILLHAIYGQLAMDELGKPFLLKAITMAHELGLFQAEIPQEDHKMKLAFEYTVWCLFASQQLGNGFFYGTRGLIESHPETILPDPLQYASWYGNMSFQYPLNTTTMSSSHGHFFKALCELRVIENDLSYDAYVSTDACTSHVCKTLSSERLTKYLVRLQSWFRTLPAVLTPENVVLPSHLKLHMEYHSLVFTISQMLEDQVHPTSEESNHLICSTSNQPGLPSMQAAIQLETIVRLYYLGHSYEYCDSYLTFFLLFVANITFQQLENDPSLAEDAERSETARSTIILCTMGLEEQGRHVYIASVLSGLIQNRLSRADIAILDTYITRQDTASCRVGENVRSAWPVTIIKPGGDLRTSRLSAIIKQYEGSC